MAVIHLVEGPVGAGKSTIASRLSREFGAPRFILDDWMATLFRPDRPTMDVMRWYSERKNRCVDQIWKLTCELMTTGSDVVLELGLIQRESREQFYDRVNDKAFRLNIYVVEASREVRRERVQSRNSVKGDTFSMEVPDHIFELASDMWEPISESECSGHSVTFISTDA